MVDARISRRRLLQLGAAGITAACAGCFGPEKDGVYALSRDDGTERWVNNLGSVDGGPTLFDETVVIGSGQAVHALSTTDGSERWNYEVEFEYTYDINDPILWNDTVLVTAGQELYALSAADGSEQWTFVGDGDGDIWLVSRPVEGVVVVGSGKTHLHGIAIEDGTERWTYEGDSLDGNSAAVADSTVYVGSRAGRAIALDVTDGTERWTFGTDKPVRGEMAAHRGLVYASTTGNRVYALTTEGGSERWRWDAPAGGEIIPLDASWPSTMALGQSVYAGYAGRLFALSASEGTERWRAETELTSMTLQQTGDTIYVSGDGLSDGSVDAGGSSYTALMAFGRRDGRERWSYLFDDDELEESPVIAENAIYAGTEAGVVHTIGKSDGKNRWTFETGSDGIFRPVIDEDTVYVGTG